MIVFEKPYITIEYLEDEHLVYTEWKGFASSEEYREALNYYVELVNKYKVTKWIGNNKKARVIHPKDQEWTLNEWLPKFAGSDVQRMAVVVADDIFNKMGVDNIRRKGSGNVKFETQYFTNVDAARAWVSEID